MQEGMPGSSRRRYGKLMTEIHMPGEIFAQSFQVNAIVVTECVLVAPAFFNDPFYHGLGRVIAVLMACVIVIFPIRLAADAEIQQLYHHQEDQQLS